MSRYKQFVFVYCLCMFHTEIYTRYTLFFDKQRKQEEEEFYVTCAFSKKKTKKKNLKSFPPLNLFPVKSPYFYLQ